MVSRRFRSCLMISLLPLLLMAVVACMAEETSRSKRSLTFTPGEPDGGDEAGDDGTPPDGSLTYYNFAKDVLDEYCVPCHDGTVAAGGGTDFTLAVFDSVDSLAGVSAKAERSKVRLNLGDMPPAGSPQPSDEVRQKLIDWIEAGAAKGTTEAEAQTLTVTAPSTAEMSVQNDRFRIAIELNDIPADAVWTAYYSLSPGTTGGTLIAASENLPISTTFVDWDTSALPAATYYIYVTLKLGTRVLAVDAASGSIKIQPNGAPSVSLTGIWKSGNGVVTLPTSVLFSGVDPEGDATTVTLEYSLNSGATWTVAVADQQNANNTVLWMPPSFPGYSARARVRLTLKDPEGNESVDQTQLDLGLTDGALTWVNFLQPLAAASCAGSTCHDAGGDADGYMDRSDFTNGVKPNAAAIDAAVWNGSMPEAGSPALTEAEKAKVRIWYWQGAN